LTEKCTFKFYDGWSLSLLIYMYVGNVAVTLQQFCNDVARFTIGGITKQSHGRVYAEP